MKERIRDLSEGGDVVRKLQLQFSTPTPSSVFIRVCISCCLLCIQYTVF